MCKEHTVHNDTPRDKQNIIMLIQDASVGFSWTIAVIFKHAIPTLFITECKMVEEHSHRYSLLYLIACQNNHDNHTITSLHFEISSGQASIKWILYETLWF